MENELIGKIALVVGEGHPLSIAIIRYFLEQGSTVIAPVKSLQELELIKAHTRVSISDQLITLLADLPDYDKVVDIAGAIFERYGKIDVAVTILSNTCNNSKLTEIPIDDWLQVIDENITASFIVARAVLEVMKKNKSGVYLNVCDEIRSEEEPSPPLLAIATSLKVEMDKAFAKECKESNIKYYHLSIRSKDMNGMPHINKGVVSLALYNKVRNKISELLNNEQEDNLFQSL
jgi:NADP-dependent 3-hydroxy acid dehydrogenase YdfG